jgi:hypothetical protein
MSKSMYVLTLADLTAAGKQYQTRTSGARTTTQNAQARAGFAMALAKMAGVSNDEGPLSDADIYALFGEKGGKGHRFMRTGVLILSAGVSNLEAFDSLPDAEKAAARDLVVALNKGGAESVTDEIVSSLVGPFDTIAAVVEALKEAVAPVSEEKKAEQKAAREEKKAREEYVASPAGKIAAIQALSADLATIAAVGGLTMEEVALLNTIGATLALIEYVEPVEVVEVEAA